VSAAIDMQPYRPLYAGIMLAVTVVTSVCAFAVARVTGGPDAPAFIAAGLVGTVSLVGLLPVMVRAVEHFGLAVLGVSMARILLALLGAVILTELGGVESRPLWLAVVAGAGIALFAESIAAIVILSSIERKRAAIRTLNPPLGPESTTTC